MVPSVGSVKLKKLSAMHVQGMYRSMLDRDLSSRTVQYTHAVLYRALKQAMRWGLVPHNVCEEVDLGATGGSLRVNRALSGGKLTTPKTKRSRRRINLSAGSIIALKAHCKRQLEERMQKAGHWQDHGLVFPSTIGTPLSHRNVVRSFKALLRRAGLPVDTRLYDLRHTCATLLLNSNVHPKYVQELLGHASISQTLDTYSHVLKGMDGGIGGAMDDALG